MGEAIHVGGKGSEWEISVPSSRFFYKPKIALKKVKSLWKKKQISILGRNTMAPGLEPSIKFLLWVLRKCIAAMNSIVNFSRLVPEPLFTEARGIAMPRRQKASGQEAGTLWSRHTAH